MAAMGSSGDLASALAFQEADPLSALNNLLQQRGFLNPSTVLVESHRAQLTESPALWHITVCRAAAAAGGRWGR
jgi:hypothetical protein